MNATVISIITPTFNQLDWLRLCIQSVRDQVLSTPSTFSIEHIVQDAGTPGIEKLAQEFGADFYRHGTQAVMSTYQESTPHEPTSTLSCLGNYSLKIFCEKDAGMYDAINRGLARSQGEICAWLNSDEQYLPGALSSVNEIFRQRLKMDILLGDAILLNSSLVPVSYRRIMVPSLWHTRLAHLHSLSCAMFFKRTALPDPPLNPRWKVIGDAVLMEYFLTSGREIHACGKPLAAYSFTGQNLSADRSCDELRRWWAATRWPPEAIRPLLILHNRIRRLFAGAYHSFHLDTQIHTPQGRKQLDGSVQGFWPEQNNA